MYTGLIIIILLASINYGNNMGYALAFLLTSVGFMSMIFTHRNMLHIQVLAGSCTPVFAGDPATFNLIIKTEDARDRIGIELQQNKQQLDQVTLPAREHHQLSLSRPTNKRGYIDAPSFRLVTRFPFGLVYTWSRDILLRQRCLVYPKPADHFSRKLIKNHSGSHSSNIRKSGDDFSGLREYQPGDSIHRIHWRASARTDKLITKLYGDDNNAVIWLDWHQLQGDTEARLSLLCRGVLDAQADDCHYGLVLPGKKIAPSSGHSHQHRCLKALACYGES
jgi:uncharacterized protein (DUF58 family)